MADLQIFELLEAAQKIEKKLNLGLIYSRLRLPQFRILMILEKSGKMTVTDLSRCLNVTRATMSVLVNQLIESQLVETVEHKKDKRSFYLQLNNKGNERLDLAKRELDMVMERLDLNLDQDTTDKLNQFAWSILNRS